MAVLALVLIVVGVVLIVVGVAARLRPLPAVQGPQGAGRERRPLRGSGAAACDPTTPRPARRSRCRSSAARARSAARSSGPASWPSSSGSSCADVALRVGRRQRAAAQGDGGGVRADPAVQGAPDRHRDPPRAQDRGAADGAAPRRRRPRVDRQPQLDPAGDRRLPARQRHRRHRRPDRRPGRARPLPARRPGDEAGHHPRQRRRPVQPLPRGPVRGPARRDRGDDLRPGPPAPAPRPPGDADPRHQRQPDQAVRREHARRRGGHGGVVHPDHQPDHERATGGRVRLRVRRAWRRGLLPRLQLDRVGHRAAAGAAAAGAAGRLRRPGSRGARFARPTSWSRSRARRR